MTELERLVVRIVGDVNQYRASLQQSIQLTTNFNQQAMASSTVRTNQEVADIQKRDRAEANSAMNRLASTRTMARGIHLISHAMQAGGAQTGLLMDTFYSLKIGGDIAKGLVHQLGAVKGGLLGIATAGALITAAHFLTPILKQMERINELAHASAQAMVEIAKGAKNASQAFGSADIDFMSKQMGELGEKAIEWAEKAGRQGIARWFGGVGKAWQGAMGQVDIKDFNMFKEMAGLELDIDKMAERIAASMRIVDAARKAVMANPAIKKIMDELNQKVGHQKIEDLRLEAEAAGLTAQEMLKLQAVRAGHKKDIVDSLVLYNQSKTAQAAARNAFRDATYSMLTPGQAEVAKMAYDGVRQKTLDMVTALQRFKEANGEAANSLRELAGNFDAFGLQKEEVLARKLERFGDPTGAAGMIRRFGAAREALEMYEQTRTPQEKFLEEIRKIDRVAAAGAIDMNTYARAVLNAGKALDITAANAQKFDAVETRSAEARARYVAQLNTFAEYNTLLSLAKQGQRLPTLAEGGRGMIAKTIGGIGPRESVTDRVMEKMAGDVGKIVEFLREGIAKIGGLELIPVQIRP